MLLLVTLARAADVPVVEHQPRTHTALVLLHTGAITLGAAAVTAGAGAVLLTDPFWHGGEGCQLPKLQGANPCGTSTLWPGLGLTTAGLVVGVSAVPLVVVGLTLPREQHRTNPTDDLSMSLSLTPGGVRVSGRF